jgi:hypothetical protein
LTTKGKSVETDLNTNFSVKTLFNKTIVFDVKVTDEFGIPAAVEIWNNNKSNDHDWFVKNIRVWKTKPKNGSSCTGVLDEDEIPSNTSVFAVERWIGEQSWVTLSSGTS